jgi:hypothetical protein
MAERSVSEIFANIDQDALNAMDDRAVDQIMIDIDDKNLTLKQIADRNNVSCADVVQVCRFHKIDINGNDIL